MNYADYEELVARLMDERFELECLARDYRAEVAELRDRVAELEAELAFTVTTL